MKHDVTLTIASLLAILLFTFHTADDIARGFEKGGPSNLATIPIAVTWLYGTLVLSGRRSGYVIIIIASLLGTLMSGIHFMNAGGVVGGGVAKSSGALFFVWSQIVLGVTSLFSLILSVRGLWSRKQGELK
jgi:hypothetical protein